MSEKKYSNENIESSSNYEKILDSYLPEDNEKRANILAFFNRFPELPKEPSDAYLQLRKYIKGIGFNYETYTADLESMIEKKTGNCLGLSILFGTVLKAQGFDIRFEVRTNIKDQAYKNDIKIFDRLTNGEEFTYQNIPELPNVKDDDPMNRFDALEHAMIIMDEQGYETTSLEGDDSDVKHNYEFESQKTATLEDLLAESLNSKAMNLDDSKSTEKIKLLQKSIELWPSRGAWINLENIAHWNFKDHISEEMTKKFLEEGGDDSLYNYHAYRLTGYVGFLDLALKQYPAYLDAFLAKNIESVSFKTDSEKREAKYNFTIAAICAATSQGIDLDNFYLNNILHIKEIFGQEEAEKLLYDSKIDEKLPMEYSWAMYLINKDPNFLVDFIKHGAIEKHTPLGNLRTYLAVIKDTENIDSQDILDIRKKCEEGLEKLKTEHRESKIFKQEMQNTLDYLNK